MEWKVVPGFDDYEVSEDGQIRRATDLLMPLGGVKMPTGTLLKPKVWNRHGYHTYRLVSRDRSRTMYAHRIVALAFLGAPPSPKHEVCHNDGDRMNNHFSNLRWGTHAENMDDCIRHGTHVCLTGRKAA
ncbi:NUMOD4 motif-containing HNH endonuclease [Rhizobium leguminosarum]|uniref:NUMOD4 motif-containing HNH endonuclease n=1 Tax=Rhizobium leguminosarum TaxID=384 RepID=UPI001030306A|nr:NUMOD4 motif-containing HNH endonuclease [Rhizobium leguminosarum]TBG41865.1 hypothetical protein ELG77_08820 [Rhizobium leguminosarum]